MNVNSRLGLTLLSLATGLLFTISWPSIGGITIIALFSLVPLLLAEEIVYQNKGRYKTRYIFLQSFLAFLVFNVGTTWWIYNASPFGMLGAVVCNAFFMAVVFMLFHLTRRVINDQVGYASLFFYWVGFEYLHFTWDLSWPWLSLGNVLSGDVSLAQWFEYTGVLGGTIWILASNVAIFTLLKRWIISKKANTKQLIGTIFILVVPPVISFFIYNREFKPVSTIEAVVVQPNIDPYNEKFNGLSSDDQLAKMMRLAASKITDSTDYVIFPETALPHGIWEEQLEEEPSIQTIRAFIKAFPGLKYITGLSSYRAYPKGTPKSATARKMGPDAYYDAYNTAMQVRENQPASLYHKSKLVIGVETTPYPQLFGKIEELAIDLGGITGSLGVDDEPSNFWNEDSTVSVAPVICYESVYGEYVGKYVQKGATMIAIITNDGWWGDTPGYRQHLALGQLRAIENRRAIARSANTGTSAFIDVRGELHQPTDYWVEDVILDEVPQYNEITFYTKYGDYLGRTAGAFAVLLILWTVAVRLNTTKKRLG